MRIFTLIMMAFLVAVPPSACSTPRAQQQAVVATAAEAPEDSQLLLINGIVEIKVHTEWTLVGGLDAGVSKEPEESDWSGTGFVVKKRRNSEGRWESLIVTADHVLRAPKVGDDVTNEYDYLGEKIVLGKRHITAVKRTIVTDLGMTCNLTPAVEGGHGIPHEMNDVSTAIADCDAGAVLPIARQTPVRGEKIRVLGHPARVPYVVITEGWIIGKIRNGMLLTSARVHGGNSGGPALYRGEVFGVVAQVNHEYDQISYLVPLEELIRRIGSTGW